MRSSVRRLLLATAAGAIGLIVFGMIVKIYNDKGEQVAKVPVPPGGKAVIET